MERVPEPELMDEPDQVLAYAGADFSVPHQDFVSRFGACFPDASLDGATVIDLGCGPADVTVRFARAYPACRIVGLDAGHNMLQSASRRVVGEGLQSRVAFVLVRLPDYGWLGQRFDAVISNSLLHHLADPLVLWDAIGRCASKDAPILVMDLLRPDDAAGLDALVTRYAAGEPPVLQQDFRNSLMAGYTADEVRDQLSRVGLPLTVRVVSDRHWIAHGRG